MQQFLSTNLWKYFGHGVGPLLLLQLGHGEHVRAVGGELAAKEEVHEEELPHHVQQVEELAEEELQSVEVVTMSVLHKIVHKNFLSVCFLIVINHRHIHICQLRLLIFQVNSLNIYLEQAF